MFTITRGLFNIFTCKASHHTLLNPYTLCSEMEWPVEGERSGHRKEVGGEREWP